MGSFLSKLPTEQQRALQRLRKAIKSAAPKAEEFISYGVPAYRLDGQFLLAFGATKRHCAFYPGALPLKTFAADLKQFSTSKGTIRFQPDQPLSLALIRRIVRARVGERGPG